MKACNAMNSQAKNLLWMIFGVSIFVFLLWRLDFRQSLEKLSNIKPAWLFLSLAGIVLMQCLGYHKWRVMYQCSRGKSREPLLPIFCSVLIMGMVTPARSGDIFASLTWKNMQGKVLAWSIFHRISEGLTTIVLSFFVLGIFFTPQYSRIQWIIAWCLFGAMVSLIFLLLNKRFGVRIFKIAKKTLSRFQSLPFFSNLLSFEEKIRLQFESFYETLSLFKKGPVLRTLIFITLGSRVLIVLVNMAILRSIGVNLPPLEVLGILAATWVGSFLSPTPQGVGIGDVAPSVMLSYFGFQSHAGAYIIMNRAFDLLIFFFWFLMGLKSVKLLRNPAAAISLT